jgi:hypothetical protein
MADLVSAASTWLSPGAGMGTPSTPAGEGGCCVYTLGTSLYSIHIRSLQSHSQRFDPCSFPQDSDPQTFLYLISSGQL